MIIQNVMIMKIDLPGNINLNKTKVIIMILIYLIIIKEYI